MTRHLLLAHGSPDPRHATFVRALVAAVTDRGPACEVAFLEHDLPRAATWLADVEEDVTALGLLLAPGYHARVDLPRLLARVTPGVTVTDRGVLGSGRWLHAALDEVIAAAGGTDHSPIAVVTAGSSRPEAGAHVADFVAEWAAERPGPAYAVTDLADLPLLALARPDALVVPHLVAPGVFADRIRERASRCGLASAAPIGTAAAFVDVLEARFAESPLLR